MNALTWVVAFLFDGAQMMVETFLHPHEFADRMAKLNPPLPADFIWRKSADVTCTIRAFGACWCRASPSPFP
jgi:hypothetical protein